MFKFDGNRLGVTASGKDFDKFKEYFGDEDRGFGYIRINVRIKYFFFRLIGFSIIEYFVITPL